MMMSRRVYTREFKLEALKELESGKSYGLVARQLGINSTLLYRWKKEYREYADKAFGGIGKPIMMPLAGEAALERKIGQLTMENDFLKKLLKEFENQRASANGSSQFTKRSRKKVKT
jgi:transposase